MYMKRNINHVCLLSVSGLCFFALMQLVEQFSEYTMLINCFHTIRQRSTEYVGGWCIGLIPTTLYVVEIYMLLLTHFFLKV